MQDYVDFYPCVTFPKEAKQPQKQISHFRSNPSILYQLFCPWISPTFWTFTKAKIIFLSLHFHEIPTLVLIFYFHYFYSLFRKTPSILVLSNNALTAKSYVADGTIKIIITNFILALKNATLASKLKKKKLFINFN